MMRGMSEARQVRGREGDMGLQSKGLQLEYEMSSTSVFHWNACSGAIWGVSRNFRGGTELKEVDHWWWVLGHILSWDFHSPTLLPFLPPNHSHFELSCSSKFFYQAFPFMVGESSEAVN